ncbi:MAG: hypothetical protein Q7R65_04280 [bacterium]|nr:hypothetical protein [bacterium]
MAETGLRDFLHDLKMRMRRSENKIPKVFICIRLRPKSQEPEKAKQEFQDNLNRAKIAVRYAVLNGHDPEATTIYFTQFLNDSLLRERELGMKIDQIRLTNCNKLWSILDKGELPSSGMVSDMKTAEENGVPIEHKDFSEIESWVKNYDNASH